MVSTAAIAEIASLVGDPARTNMLSALMDGRALTAAHLARLTEAGLLTMARQGRHHYHLLASRAVAQMLESIMAVAAFNEAGDFGAAEADCGSARPGLAARPHML